MIEAATLLGIVAIIQNMINAHSEERARTDESYRQALAALGEAVNATQIYVQRHHEGGARDEEKEERLSSLWERAGHALRTINPELARRCRFKGKYWQNPSNWTSLQLDGLNIRLRTVTLELERLLSPRR